MDEEDIKERIADWEDFRTEFIDVITKSTSEQLAKCMVAFANSEGGDIIAGVRADRQIAGVQNVNAALKIIEEVATRKCEPPVTVYPKTMFLDGKPLIVISVAKGVRKPYKTLRGTYYIRTGPKIRPASRDELLSFFKVPASHYYNDNPLYSSTPDDIHTDAFCTFLKSAGILEECGISGTGAENPTISSEMINHYLTLFRVLDGNYLTVAGCLFFAKNPQRFIPYSVITLTKYSGMFNNTPMEWSVEFSGRIPEMIEDTVKRISTEALSLKIPGSVVREAVINAVAHREYSISLGIKVSLFSDRIEIKNPGPLKPPVSLHNIKYKMHSLRNPLIYSILKTLGYVSTSQNSFNMMSQKVRAETGHDIRINMNYDEFTVLIPGKDFNEDSFDESENQEYLWGL
ncbi:MAG: putative DNA binding domain-containing protein [Thermoplasmata archaeon]